MKVCKFDGNKNLYKVCYRFGHVVEEGARLKLCLRALYLKEKLLAMQLWAPVTLCLKIDQNLLSQTRKNFFEKKITCQPSYSRQLRFLIVFPGFQVHPTRT